MALLGLAKGFTIYRRYVSLHRRGRRRGEQYTPVNDNSHSALRMNERNEEADYTGDPAPQRVGHG